MAKSKPERKPLTTAERQQVKQRFGDVGCSFAKDNKGIFAYTHRARSDSYPTVDKIPKARVKFVDSTC